MMNKKRIADVHTYMPVMREILSQGKEVSVTITGNSMSPFMVHGRDEILISPPTKTWEKGDMAFFQRVSGQYVMFFASTFILQQTRVDKSGTAGGTMMDFRQIFYKLTGVSTPVFGLSWNPPVDERDTAKRIIVFLEGRRVLYAPESIEIAEYCIDSVLEIKNYLTHELQNSSIDAEINLHIREMRTACNMFLSNFRKKDYQQCFPFFKDQLNEKETEFLVGLVTLRKVFAASMEQISRKYRIEIQGPLSGMCMLNGTL